MKSIKYSNPIKTGSQLIFLLAIVLFSLGPGISGTAYAVNCYTLDLVASPNVSGTVSVNPLSNCNLGGVSGYTEGTIVQLTAIANTKYSFINWTGDVTGSLNPSSIAMNGNKSVTAKFAPANDHFASATLINDISYSNSVNINEATQDPTDPDNIGPCDGKQLNIGNNSIWYKYTPSVNESIAVDTIGSTFAPNIDLDTFIAVWTGTEGSLSLVKCDDDNLVGQTSELSFVAQANVTYYFEVATFNCLENDPDGCSKVTSGNVIFNVNITNTEVNISGTRTGSYYVYPQKFISDRYGINGGPVHVVSTAGLPILTSQRAVYGSSFNSIVGYPGNQLTTEYWFTSLDDLGMITYLVIGNPSTTLTATVDVYIAGTKMNSTPYSIAPGQRVFPRYGINGGPVRVVSTNGVPIFTSERTKYGNSFNEVLGYPANQLTTEYWFTSLDDLGMITYLVIGNPSTNALTATVDVYIAGVKKTVTPFSIAPGQRVFPRYGINGGPVRVVSTNGVPIFTSERSKFQNSFNEVLGYPANKFTADYWFTTLDDKTSNMITYLVVANPSTTLTATVDVFIDGVKINTTPYSILPGQRVFPRYGVNNGPVHVVSTNGVPIFTSERTKYLSSFNEILGLPTNQLTTDYWFTSLDDLGMITELVVAAPGP